MRFKRLNSAMITFGSVTRGLSNHHRFARTDRTANRKPATSPDRCDHIIAQLTQAVGLEVPGVYPVRDDPAMAHDPGRSAFAANVSKSR